MDVNRLPFIETPVDGQCNVRVYLQDDGLENLFYATVYRHVGHSRVLCPRNFTSALVVFLMNVKRAC
jgi:hypothetical protein